VRATTRSVNRPVDTHLRMPWFCFSDSEFNSYIRFVLFRRPGKSGPLLTPHPPSHTMYFHIPNRTKGGAHVCRQIFFRPVSLDRDDNNTILLFNLPSSTLFYFVIPTYISLLLQECRTLGDILY